MVERHTDLVTAYRRTIARWLTAIFGVQEDRLVDQWATLDCVHHICEPGITQRAESCALFMWRGAENYGMDNAFLVQPIFFAVKYLRYKLNKQGKEERVFIGHSKSNDSQSATSFK